MAKPSSAVWKSVLERLLQVDQLDWHEAVTLVGDIARLSPDMTLRQAATQALPILRSAASLSADHVTLDAARRRLIVVLDVLIELTTPRFGRRGAKPKPLSPEQRARKLLGLPIDGILSAPDIHSAFRRAAKTMHPDAGGSESAFRELVAAQDVLMKRPA
ncbi:J domain-containing protein [Bradyrhizobium sp. STM 3557]|uniref:J domain-containing protein n=1 Tax=Bradyrhizobium sp. STM 3557 TaxID=578920 RepID=UPI00388CFF69